MARARVKPVGADEQIAMGFRSICEARRDAPVRRRRREQPLAALDANATFDSLTKEGAMQMAALDGDAGSAVRRRSKKPTSWRAVSAVPVLYR